MRVTEEVTLSITYNTDETDPPSQWAWPVLLDVLDHDVTVTNRRAMKTPADRAAYQIKDVDNRTETNNDSWDVV